MLKVSFYDSVEDKLLKFAVIVARSRGKWVFCKHRDRSTFEFPGGHREEGEDILTCARRELYEETGAAQYALHQVCVYSVYGFDGAIKNTEETHGMLYYADIIRFEELPGFEMERIQLFDELPEAWTYPEIQPLLLNRVREVTTRRDLSC